MTAPPAFQFYVKQWLADDNILLMDWDAKAMHLHFICIAWQQHNPCTLPNDDELLQRWCNFPKDWERLKKQIFRAWRLDGDRWIQDGLLEIFLKQQAFSESRKQNALKRDYKKSSGMQVHSTREMKKKKEVLVNKVITLDEVLAEIQARPAFKEINVALEYEPCRVWWLDKEGHEPTKGAITNWMKKAETRRLANIPPHRNGNHQPALMEIEKPYLPEFKMPAKKESMTRATGTARLIFPAMWAPRSWC